MTDHPIVAKAPGLTWRKHRSGRWEARWRPRSDLVERGYPANVYRLWIGRPEEFTELDMAEISGQCHRMQGEMLMWGRGGTPVLASYDGTLTGLIRAYQTDPDSSYQKLRYQTKRNYTSLLRALEQDCGTDPESHADRRIDGLKARHFLRWHEQWTQERGPGMARGLIGTLRTVLTFGATILEDKGCLSVKTLLSNMRFKGLAPRSERLTAEQATALRAKAHELGHPSIALAQSIQFECTLRQRDVIGEWVPQDEPGTSDVLAHGQKWLRGVRWSEIDENLILRHLTSKREKVIVVDLKKAPMVLEELVGGLNLVSGLNRTKFPSTGPMIIREKTGLPWQAHDFRAFWRAVATAAGIPKNVWNMDSRAGAITEATDSGAPLEDVRHAATHSNVAMTAKYSRNSEGKTARVMDMRVAFREKKT
jgi:hypothetical protein